MARCRIATGVSKRVVALLCSLSAAFVLVQAAPALAAHDPAFVRAIGAVGLPTCTSSCVAGSQGGDAGQLSVPVGAAVSGSGDVYVADEGNNRVSVFSQAGVFLRAFGKDVGGSGVDVCTGTCGAGSAGGNAGQLNCPDGVAVTGSGDVYVADAGNSRVSEFSQAGVFVRA